MAQERYMTLNGKYLEDAERLLEQADYPQASEKLWGAVATAVKAAATTRHWRHSSHRELRNAIQTLSAETGDSDLRRLFAIAEALHANFYEDWMDAETVRIHAEDARRLVAKLQALAG